MSSPNEYRFVRQIQRNHVARQFIEARLPFSNKTGSFRASAVFGVRKSDVFDTWIDAYNSTSESAPRFRFPTGHMPDRYRDEFARDLDEIASYRGNVYVVTSYDSVIGWTRSIEHAGKFYVPDVEYTRTTSKHQDVARRVRR